MDKIEQEIKTENPEKMGIKKRTDVGYKRPPKEYQFKKGQIANPTGKEKGTLSIKTKIRQRFKANPKEFKKFIGNLIEKYPGLVWQMLEGTPVSAIDLTTGGESFFRPTLEEKQKALRALKDLE